MSAVTAAHCIMGAVGEDTFTDEVNLTARPPRSAIGPLRGHKRALNLGL